MTNTMAPQRADAGFDDLLQRLSALTPQGWRALGEAIGNRRDSHCYWAARDAIRQANQHHRRDPQQRRLADELVHRLAIQPAWFANPDEYAQTLAAVGNLGAWLADAARVPRWATDALVAPFSAAGVNLDDLLPAGSAEGVAAPTGARIDPAIEFGPRTAQVRELVERLARLDVDAWRVATRSLDRCQSTCAWQQAKRADRAGGCQKLPRAAYRPLHQQLQAMKPAFSTMADYLGAVTAADLAITTVGHAASLTEQTCEVLLQPVVDAGVQVDDLLG